MKSRRDGWERTISKKWPVVIVGGGITGTGILRHCSLCKIPAVLLEKGDFASGTSSWSSKLVHGGMRYLQQFQWRLSHESIKERDRLLSHGEGLVNRIDLLYATYRSDPMPKWMVEMGLAAYGLISRKMKRPYQRLGAERAGQVLPQLNAQGLTGLYQYWDAQSDDCGLVMRVLREARAQGGEAVNYTQVDGFLTRQDGRVCGVAVTDQVSGRTGEIEADVVINATGPWSDSLRSQLELTSRLRPLRGSHLLFPTSHFPLDTGIFFSHPRDGRFVFAIPWMGRVLVGSTDLDHDQDLDRVPRPTSEELRYILDGIQHRFDLPLDLGQAVSAFAGVRPVIRSGREVPPSKESREHAVWSEKGLVTVTGGKLTTFGVIARDTLKELARQGVRSRGGAKQAPLFPGGDPFFLAPPAISSLERVSWLNGRYGPDIFPALQRMEGWEREAVGEGPYWSIELSWACREDVVYLEDLLLRRTRLGLLLPGGGSSEKERIKRCVVANMGWDEATWEREWERYISLWNRTHSPEHLLETEDRKEFE